MVVVWIEEAISGHAVLCQPLALGRRTAATGSRRCDDAGRLNPLPPPCVQQRQNANNSVDENVFLFVPNLIGYARVILAGVALYEMPTHPKACTIAYGVSCLLDAVDGQAARALGQSSKFGAVLDMVTDRCTTACLLCYLASAYPRLALLFQFLISLDFASHYIHMYS